MDGKVLLVSSHAAPKTGGSAVVYDQLSRAALGSIKLLTAFRDYETGSVMHDAARFDRAAPYEVIRVPLLRPLAVEAGSKFRLYAAAITIMLRALLAVVRACFRHDIKVVCIGDLISLGWMTAPLRRLFRKRVILYVHGEEIGYTDNGFLYRLRGKVLHEADAVVVVSRATADAVAGKYGVDRSKIFLCPNGVDTDKYRPDLLGAIEIRERHGLTGKPLVLGVGRLIERKGFDTLVAAMASVVETVPDAVCLIVGTGPEERQLQKLIQGHGLQNNVRLLGAVDDPELVALYSAADVFAMPNRTLPNGDTEGFGLVFLEANACGAPVVAGRAGGAVDAVAHGESGLLVDSSDPHAVAEAIASVLKSPPLREALSKGGHARALRSQWRQRAEAFMELCSAVAARRQPKIKLSDPDTSLRPAELPAGLPASQVRITNGQLGTSENTVDELS